MDEALRVGVLGTGMVGQALGSRLVELGHEVTMGAREAGNERALEWSGRAGERASESAFEGAASFGELVVNATAGVASLDALASAGAENLAGKVLIDVANPIAPGSGGGGALPVLAFCNTESLAERIQAAFPEARVVKALNTVNASVMVDPGQLAEPTSTFVCGDDPEAKATVADLLESFGWQREQVIDLGGILSARGMEMYLAFWLRNTSALGSPLFNVRIVRADDA